ncbi:hypothetical protein WMY93_001377 [Mugilogobius chulae]|uniref:Uncharacterized protein n=1 Tax=Mugilogobius chulae TaxID=88201 RepID=A0AAW0QGY9_9GOBI
MVIPTPLKVKGAGGGDRTLPDDLLAAHRHRDSPAHIGTQSLTENSQGGGQQVVQWSPVLKQHFSKAQGEQRERGDKERAETEKEERGRDKSDRQIDRVRKGEHKV